MKWNVATKLGAGFGLALLIFVIVGIVSYQATVRLVDASEIRKHTYEVLEQLADLRLFLKEMELGQRNYVLMDDENDLESYQGALGKIEPTLERIRKLTQDNPHQQARLDKLEPLVKSRLDFSAQTINARRDKGMDAALQLIKSGTGTQLTDAIFKLLGEMDNEENELLEKRATAADADARHAEETIIYGTLAAFIFAAIAGFLITRNIAGPLGSLTAAADRITTGDLSAIPPQSARADEIGVLTRAFDRMIQSLRNMAGVAEQIAAGDLRVTVQPQSERDVLGHAFVRMSDNLRQQIGGLAESANVLGTSVTQIVAATSQLAAGATESATAVSETTTTVEEVRQTAQMASQKARAVADTAQKAVQISQTGAKSTEEVISGMKRIREQMEAIAGSMVRLSEQSQTIGQIIATVEDLAAQSNLLAVNAAIEAAKAGEQGKGFGVVAQEVKSLAEQSRQATNQVRTILTDIQKATTAAVMATEQGVKAVESGGRQTEAAGESIQILSGGVTEAAQAATQIAASSQQQLVGMDQVAVAMESIKQASTQNVASARQLESAARSIDELGRRLKQMTERYTL